MAKSCKKIFVVQKSKTNFHGDVIFSKFFAKSTVKKQTFLFFIVRAKKAYSPRDTLSDFMES